MPLPPKELYTIAEVASRWNIPKKTVEDYLLTEKLQPSILLPRKLVHKFTPVEYHYEDDDMYDVDRDDPDSIRFRYGIFDLVDYPGIVWSEQGQCKFEKGMMCLSLPDEEDCYFGFDETFILNREDVLITLSELDLFEAEHGIIVDITAQKANSQIVSGPVCLDDSTADSILPISLPSQKDNLKDTTDSINPKRETTLLTVIAALLEIISGEFVSRDVTKHPSIKNQNDLIDKLADLETRGLSKRNLQGIFSDAKEAKKRN